MVELDDKVLESLYDWLDSIPFSRPKKNIARDFSDGVLAAELINYFFPNLIQLHNYPPTNSVANKKCNWATLSRKVLTKLNCQLSEHTINELATSKREATQYFLLTLRGKLSEAMKIREEKQLRQGEAQYSPRGRKQFRDALPKSSDLTENKYTDNKGCRKSIWPPDGEDVDEKAFDRLTIDYDKQTGDTVNYVSKTKPWFPSGPGFDSVPMSVYEQKQQEVLMREETIQILQARIRRLEHMIRLKDVRIEEMNQIIEEMSSEKVVAPISEIKYPLGLAEVNKRNK